MTGFPVRIPPLAPEDFTAEQERLVGDWTHLLFSRVLIHSPRAYAVFVPYIEAVIARTNLPPRDRQAVCLRMLQLCGDVYELTHHLVISRKAGLSEAEIEAFRSGEGDCLTDFDRALLQATQELKEDQFVSDASWAALGQRYTPEQQMEVVFLAGCYLTMAMLTRSFGIQLEPDLESFNAIRSYT